MGLFDMFGAAPGALYGNGLLSPQQQQAIAFQGLLGAAGSFGQTAMPSRMPVPIGAVLGQGAAGMGQAENQAGELALKGGLLGLQGQEIRAKLDMYRQAMQPPPPMYAPGQGVPGVAPQAPSSTPQPQGLLSTPAGAPSQGPSSPLPLIKASESGGNYNIGYGGTDLSKAPLDANGFPIWEGKEGPEGISHAAGGYQIQPDTWAKYAPMAGVKDFSPASQDAVARLIYMNEGIKPWSSNPRLMSALGGSSGSGPQTPPPPPRAQLPGTGESSINPDYVSWAQGQARIYTTLGMKVPDYLNQAAALPMVGATESAKKGADFTYDAALKAYQKQLDIAGAGPIAGATAAAQYPFKVGENWNKPEAVRPGATVINPGTGKPVYSAPIATPNVDPATGNTTQGWSYPPGAPNAPASGSPTTASPGGGLVPGGAANPYGVPPSLARPSGSPTPSMTPTAPITKLSPERTEELEGVGKTNVETRQANIDAANAAQQTQATLNDLKANAGQFYTGPFSEHVHDAMSVLRTMGYTGADNSVASYEDFVKNAGALTRNAVKETSPRAAVQEFKLIGNALPNPDMSPQGLTRVINEYNGLSNYKIAKGQAQATWEKRPGSSGVGDVTGFETDWQKNVSPYAFIVMSMDPADRRNMLSQVAKQPGGQNEIKQLQAQIHWAVNNGLDM